MPLSPKVRVALALGWAVLILVLCAIPGEDFPDSRLFELDKLGHFAMFFVGVLLWLAAWPERVGSVVVVALALSVLTEVFQGLLPIGRSADGLDVVADVAGVLAGLATFFVLRRRRKPAAV